MKNKEKILLIIKFISIGFIIFCGIEVLIDAILKHK